EVLKEKALKRYNQVRQKLSKRLGSFSGNLVLFLGGPFEVYYVESRDQCYTVNAHFGLVKEICVEKNEVMCGPSTHEQGSGLWEVRHRAGGIGGSTPSLRGKIHADYRTSDAPDQEKLIQEANDMRLKGWSEKPRSSLMELHFYESS
ncbi:notchless homolog 1, partial [Pelobates cultripes]